MKTVRITDRCIGCGACVAACPEVFGPGAGVAVVVGSAGPAVEDAVVEAAEVCPADAIRRGGGLSGRNRKDAGAGTPAGREGP